jgi:hypothetical protein
VRIIDFLSQLSIRREQPATHDKPYFREQIIQLFVDPMPKENVADSRN